MAGMTVLRVLNVARHWITKFPEVSRQLVHCIVTKSSRHSLINSIYMQDFDGDALLKSKMQVLLEELLRNSRLNVSNRKVAFQLSKEMLNDQLVESRLDPVLLMTPTEASH